MGGVVIDGRMIQTGVVSSASLTHYETCPAAGVFQARQKYPVHPAAWYGIFVHRFLEYVNRHGHAKALDYIRTKKNKNVIRVCERIDPRDVPQGETEVAYAHNVFDGYSRRLRGGFSADPGTELFGKADVCVWGDVMPHVVDYKCGPQPSDPDGNTQLLGLAESIRKAEGWTGAVKTSICAVTSEGKLPMWTKTVSAMELDDYAGRARRSLTVILDNRVEASIGGYVPFVTGSHCTWCNLKPECPMWVGTSASQR